MFSKALKLVLQFFKLYAQDNKHIYKYKIEEINETSNSVIISCKGKGVTLITSIDEIGRDEYIINFLPSHHACWIGYYFGKKWLLNKEKCSTGSSKSPNLTETESVFNIICQNRIGEIIYQNTNNGVMHKMPPLDLAQSKLIIQFSPSQAYYVGFLAALQNAKIINKQSTLLNKIPTYLKIVK